MEAATGTTTPLFPLERSLPLSTLIGEELILAKDGRIDFPHHLKDRIRNICES